MKQSTGIKVTLKAAVTVDGKIATGSGHSKWITGDAARLKAHQLRHENDAILVGINTVLTDDPELTVRGIEEGRSPVRIVLDSKARIPGQSRLFQNDSVPVIIITGNQAPSRIWPDLAELKIIEAPEETPDILWVLSELKKLGLKSLLVEGGSLIHASFLKSNCVDQLALFMAPKIIGGQDSLSWCGDLNVENVKDACQLDISSITTLGEDWFISAKLK
ncbi:MAG: bifunctional diaminohydroxyphosphoribosylaminopyrimidine deaminase/5-amino-6-(5-phosphoribosylamino)uracil reductase RibD [Proteobacteria bacterium]|jgi:diaminohydroxyphosphoribosylaminopyrimidine deaminase/5-amino-6-(5-phosphoribosylamino)uracil reductase|nr:bifunctional diaminohydroxyphosphoribosylaminopyrimidine deaminase/5-amino-6-(5-phosphoribosylamino)uracil reductase RibD [Pseudomonadota bacterium]MBT5795708.1 bifunctional diaminohydroxyphosphoribosylaminopyrimidine deaminase/5-amino-6-(5-phosphoribosylamino)uracil reductase RibD [Deltaproteobacteria bacterium]MDB3917088.1 bifunctional diaminohydroxyphosphoribosylaminopyrimidine deaminase/5-amino-6-(5-phosphoribosylamino)uracil reductase RibD [bacterium]